MRTRLDANRATAVPKLAIPLKTAVSETLHVEKRAILQSFAVEKGSHIAKLGVVGKPPGG